MLAVGNHLPMYVQQQPSIAAELLQSIANSYTNFLEAREFQRRLKQVESRLFEITKVAHEYNAKMETVRDFVDNYYINDIEQDEAILNQFVDIIEDITPHLEEILDSLESQEFPQGMKNSIISAYDELYGTIININFAISQKIAMAYLDGQSDTAVLQEA